MSSAIPSVKHSIGFGTVCSAMQGFLFGVSAAYPFAQGTYLSRQLCKFAVIEFHHGVSYRKPSDSKYLPT